MWLPVAALALSGCVSHGKVDSRTSTSTETATTTGPTSTRSPSPGETMLRCGDSITGYRRGEGSSGDLVVDGVELESLRPPGGQAYPATEVAPGIPASDSRYFRKAPIYLPAGAGPVTIEVVRPRGVTLAWVPGSLWTDPRRTSNMADFETRRLTLEGCDQPTAYLGGILTTEPTVCITLDITTARGGPTQVVAGIGGATCRSD